MQGGKDIERRVPPAFMSPRKSDKRAANLDDFKKDVSRIVFEFYDRGESPTVK
jgi:hypothetical protein